MEVPTQRWPGLFVQRVDAPYSNEATASLAGTPVTVRGSDGPGYQLQVLNGWAGIARQSRAPDSPGVRASWGAPSGELGFLETAGISAGGFLLGLVIVTFGLLLLVSPAVKKALPV